MATTLLGSTGASRRNAVSGQRLPLNATGPNGWLASSATSSPSTTPKATSPSCENLAMRIPRGYASRESHRGGRTVMPARTSVVVCGIALAMFFGISALVWTGTLDGVDTAVWHFGERHHSDAAVTLARIVTDVLQPVVTTAALLGGAAVLARRRRDITPLAVAIVVVVAVSAVVLGLKYAMDRPLPHSHGHGQRGFPSGHTAAAAGFLGTLAVLAAGHDSRLRRRLLGLAAALTALVVVGLVYAGYHWLTDTLASIALSIAVLAALALDRLGRSSFDPRAQPGVTVERGRRP